MKWALFSNPLTYMYHPICVLTKDVGDVYTPNNSISLNSYLNHMVVYGCTL